MASNKKMLIFMAVIKILTITYHRASAADPDLLQDVCVADLNSREYLLNNLHLLISTFSFLLAPCALLPATSDFASMGIAQPGVPNIFGTRIGTADVHNMPGLNTQGVSMSRVDFDIGGLNPPHSHLRATEIIFLARGELRAGFITTDNVLVNKYITRGEVFVFPRGLIHFQFNVGKGPATTIVGFNSQNPGVQLTAISLFASRPSIPDDVVAQAFQISVEEVQEIRARLAPPCLMLFLICHHCN